MQLFLVYEKLFVRPYHRIRGKKELHEFDPRADQIPLGQKRKRGRPTKTATALLRQQE